MSEQGKTFHDISPIAGIYSNFIYMKDESLVCIIRVKGINFDLLSHYQQEHLFEEYGAFITQNAHYNIQNVSMTVPIRMGDYLRNWKKVYLLSVQNDKCNEALKQLRASYLHEFQQNETNLTMAKKEHFIVLKEELRKPTIEHLNEAEKKLYEKAEEISRSIGQVLEMFDSEQEILTANEALSVLHRLLDYKMSIYE